MAVMITGVMLELMAYLDVNNIKSWISGVEQIDLVSS